MISSPTKKKAHYSPRISPEKSPDKLSIQSPTLSPEKITSKNSSPKTFRDLTSRMNNNEASKFTYLEAYEKGVIDHEIRDHKAKTMAHEYMKSKEFQEFRDYWLDQKYESLHYVIPNTMRSTFEKIIGIYHIHLSYLEVTTMDSAVELIAPSDFSNLNFLLGCLIPYITQIPYTFYKKMKLSTINICEDIKLLNETRIANFNQKLYGCWFFCLCAKDPEIVKRHFFNCMCYNLMRSYENFDQVWTSYNRKDLIDVTLVDESNLKEMRGFLNKECMRSVLRDQFEHFYLLMHFPNKMLNHHDKIIAQKAALMKEAIDNFDTVGITASFWEKRGLYTPKKTDNSKEEL